MPKGSQGTVYNEEQYYDECERLDGTQIPYNREYNRLVALGRKYGYRIPRRTLGSCPTVTYIAPKELWGVKKTYTDRFGNLLGVAGPARRERDPDLDYSTVDKMLAEEERERNLDQLVRDIWAGKLDGVRRVNDGTELTTEQLIGDNIYQDDTDLYWKRRLKQKEKRKATAARRREQPE